MKEDAEKRVLKVLNGEVLPTPPVWLMRQAGRYLPEYRALRQQTGSFWRMCMTPELAVEVTLQPIRRFDLDAAIIFSDILVVPYALGLDVTFEEGAGPALSAISRADGLIGDPSVWAERLAPTYGALAAVRAALSKQTTLLGFAGAPWTLATYMAEGKGSADQRLAKLWGYRKPVEFSVLLDRIGDCVAFHLLNQLDAGADAVQIFDSWASSLPEDAFADWVIAPTRRIVDKVRQERPKARIIGFPRMATLAGYEAYARETGVDAISVDTSAPMGWAAAELSRHVAVQGNLDPIALIAGGDAMRNAADHIVKHMAGKPFIFNLGHGILPETPPEHVAELVARLRGQA